MAARVVVAGVGCATVRMLPPLAPPEEMARGTSSVRFVIVSANPNRDLPKDVQLHPPVPAGELRLPEDPSRALASRAGPATVGPRLVVGVEGRVTGVSESPVVATTAARFREDFLAAAAVWEWTIAPAWLAKLANGPHADGDGAPDYRTATSLEAIPVYLDVRIDFEIVGGHGRTRVSGLPERGGRARPRIGSSRLSPARAAEGRSCVSPGSVPAGSPRARGKLPASFGRTRTARRKSLPRGRGERRS